MSLIRQLSGLTTPDRGRWKAMFMGLAVALGAVQAAALLQPPPFVMGLLVFVVMIAWVVGACAMVGYVRWIFRSEIERVEKEAASGKEERSK
jgi:flagellar basal body-associated protein FliL